MSDKLTIAVIGAGGMGGFYGGALARAGHNVTLIARGEHLSAIKQHGFKVKSALLGNFHLDIEATDNMAEIGPVDLVILAVKSWGTEQAIRDMGPLVGRDTTIISTQNGIDSERQLQEAFNQDNVIGCTVTVSAMIESPGVITQPGGPGTVVIGEMKGGLSDRVSRLAMFLEEAGLPATAHENVKRALWEKFIFICGLSGMTALTRKPIGDIFAQEITTEMYFQVLEEVTAVARAEGVDLPGDVAATIMATTQAREPFIIGSMGHDLIAGNSIEIGILNGRVTELGRLHGFPTPANFAITAALMPHEHGTR